MPSNHFSNGAREKKSTKLSHFLDFRTQPNPTQTPKLDFEISIFGFSKSDFRTSRDSSFWIFSKKCVFRGSVCENEKVNLGIAPQLFLSSNGARKRYKNIARSQRKVSRIRPRETHFFEKIRKHGSGLVRKWAQNRPSKKWVHFEFLSSAKKFAFLGTFWARKVEKIDKNFSTDFSEKSTRTPLWVENRSENFFRILDFPGSKSAQKDDPFGPTQKFDREPTFFSKSQKCVFWTF